MPFKELDTFFFWNSGAEAIEAAVKLARHATGKTNIHVFQGGYHGRTIGTMALTTSKTIYRAGYGPLMSGVTVSPFPYAHQFKRWLPPSALKNGMTKEEVDDVCTKYCLEQLRLTMCQQASAKELAAMVIEPVQGEGGYVVPPTPFMKALRTVCDENGILLIADEVQSGFGRTGKFFAMEHFDVRPDM
jgi:4-aminobutyrate aminotransferase